MEVARCHFARNSDPCWSTCFSVLLSARQPSWTPDIMTWLHVFHPEIFCCAFKGIWYRWHGYKSVPRSRCLTLPSFQLPLFSSLFFNFTVRAFSGTLGLLEGFSDAHRRRWFQAWPLLLIEVSLACATIVNFMTLIHDRSFELGTKNLTHIQPYWDNTFCHHNETSSYFNYDGPSYGLFPQRFYHYYSTGSVFYDADSWLSFNGL